MVHGWADPTAVTGTIIGADGLPYANGTISALLTNSAGVSYDKLPYNAQTANIPIQSFSAPLDSTGSFAIALAPNSLVTGSFWTITGCNGGNTPACFTYLATITGASQSLTSQLSAAAVAALSSSSSATVAYVNMLTGANTKAGIGSNLVAVRLNRWRHALENVRTGNGNARILFVGDSTTAGIGGSTAATQPWIKSQPTRLAQLMNTAITPTAVGLGVPPSILGGSADTRWVAGSGWSQQANFGAGGGASWHAGTGTSGNLVYTSTINADQYYVYYLTAPGLGTLTLTATGGTPVVVNCAATAGSARVLVTAASAATSNTLTAVTSGSGGTYLTGVEPLLSATSQVLIGNAGVGSSTTTSWTSFSPFGGNSLITTVAPDLTIISLGINDANAGLSATAFSTNLQSLINSALVTGDVIICTWPPNQTAGTLATMLVYYPYIYQLGSSNTHVVVGDIFYRFGSTWNSPFMSDPAHPNDQGYFDWAQSLYNLLQ